MWTSKRIKELRRLYGERQGRRTETQAELAARLRVDVTTVQWWEQDKGMPSGPAALMLDRLEEDLLAGAIREL